MIRLLFDNKSSVNIPHCPGIDTYNSIFHILLYNGWPVELVEPDEVTNDVDYFYTVKPQEFLLNMNISQKTMIDYIPENSLNLIKNHQRVKFLVYFPWEGFDLSLYDYTVVRFFNHCVEHHNIPADKIYFVYGDRNIEHILDTLDVKFKIPYKNILGVNIFEYISYIDSTKNTLVPTDHLRSLKGYNKPKRFLFKNGNARPQRAYLLGAFHHLDLLKHFHYSWLNHYNVELNDRYLNSFFRSFSPDDTQYKEYIDSFKKLNENAPIVLDKNPDAMTSRENQILQSDKLTIDSYVTLVSETVVDMNDRGCLFTSEKTYQPIYQLHPFISVGCPGTLEYLRECGYETFPELFDETYDKMENKADRLNAIVKEVDKFTKIPTDKLNDIYYSEYILDKLVHNRLKFNQRQGRSEFFRFINWISK